MRIAVVTDLHFAKRRAAIPARRSDLADRLLAAAVRELNARVHPDVVLLPGDILDCGDGPDACELRNQIAGILREMCCPHLILPGNHDGDPALCEEPFPYTVLELDGPQVRVSTRPVPDPQPRFPVSPLTSRR